MIPFRVFLRRAAHASSTFRVQNTLAQMGPRFRGSQRRDHHLLSWLLVLMSTLNLVADWRTVASGA